MDTVELFNAAYEPRLIFFGGTFRNPAGSTSSASANFSMVSGPAPNQLWQTDFIYLKVIARLIFPVRRRVRPRLYRARQR
jgi:hypothetical protein